ncbi:MAG: hypothetical protein EXR86_10875 [Gammaproteobacteria bacterium]|nr:hypothetical protein [Gammaproteobacteria bacterium]
MSTRGNIPSSSNGPDAWREKYRELCREADADKAAALQQARLLRKALQALTVRHDQVPGVSPAALAALQQYLTSDPGVPFDAHLLTQVIDACVGAHDAVPSKVEPWVAFRTLLDKLHLAPRQDFELKQLRARCNPPNELLGWVAQLAAMLNDRSEPPRKIEPEAPTGHLLALLDWLLLPAEFERNAAILRESLERRELEDPIHATGSFLNDLHAFLRRDLRTLGDYLKKSDRTSEFGREPTEPCGTR